MMSIKEYHEFLDKVVPKLVLLIQFSPLRKDKIQKILPKMALYGWYADNFTNNTGINFTTCLQNIYSYLHEKMDEHLMDYYRNRLPIIEEKIITQFPTLVPIFSEAILAHNKGMYHSSINLF